MNQFDRWRGIVDLLNAQGYRDPETGDREQLVYMAPSEIRMLEKARGKKAETHETGIPSFRGGISEHGGVRRIERGPARPRQAAAAPMEMPSGLGLEGLSPLQQLTKIATFGTSGQGQYATSDVQNWWKKALANQLEAGQSIMPIEQQYAEQVIGTPSGNMTSSSDWVKALLGDLGGEGRIGGGNHRLGSGTGKIRTGRYTLRYS